MPGNQEIVADHELSLAAPPAVVRAALDLVTDLRESGTRGNPGLAMMVVEAMRKDLGILEPDLGGGDIDPIGLAIAQLDPCEPATDMRIRDNVSSGTPNGGPRHQPADATDDVSANHKS